MNSLAAWSEFVLAYIAFFLSHAVPVRPAIRARLVAVLSAQGFTVAYSLLSVAVLAWLIAAAGRAPVVTLWNWAPWQNHITYVGMAGALAILALAIGRPNPLSFGGANNAAYDPSQPGIIGWSRHPLLLALLIWSLSHVPPNGTVSHVILFGSFATFSAFGMRLIDRRKRRSLGHTEWQRLSRPVREISPTRNGGLRLLAAALLYALLLALHGPVIGVQPAF